MICWVWGQNLEWKWKSSNYKKRSRQAEKFKKEKKSFISWVPFTVWQDGFISFGLWRRHWKGALKSSEEERKKVGFFFFFSHFFWRGCKARGHAQPFGLLLGSQGWRGRVWSPTNTHSDFRHAGTGCTRSQSRGRRNAQKHKGTNWHKVDTRALAQPQSVTSQCWEATATESLSASPVLSTHICNTLRIVIFQNSVSKWIVHPKLNPFSTILTVVTEGLVAPG